MNRELFATAEIGFMDISGLKELKQEYPLYLEGDEIGAVQLMIQGKGEDGRQPVRALLMVNSDKIKELPKFFKIEPRNYSISYGKLNEVYSFFLKDIEEENLSYISQVVYNGRKS